VKIVSDLSESYQPHCSILERSAVLALSKLMCISEDFCKRHIDLLISLLGNQRIDPVIKNNVLITLGDLLHRYPNTIEPFSTMLYRCLRDNNVGVKKTSLMVITHLILSDMLKVKINFKIINI